MISVKGGAEQLGVHTSDPQSSAETAIAPSALCFMARLLFGLLIRSVSFEHDGREIGLGRIGSAWTQEYREEHGDAHCSDDCKGDAEGSPPCRVVWLKRLAGLSVFRIRNLLNREVRHGGRNDKCVGDALALADGKCVLSGQLLAVKCTQPVLSRVEGDRNTMHRFLHLKLVEHDARAGIDDDGHLSQPRHERIESTLRCLGELAFAATEDRAVEFRRDDQMPKLDFGLGLVEDHDGRGSQFVGAAETVRCAGMITRIRTRDSFMEERSRRSGVLFVLSNGVRGRSCCTERE